MKKLFTTETTDATSDPMVVANSNPNAKVLSIHCFGTFDTATVSVYMSNNGVTNGHLEADLTFTAAGFKNIEVANEVTIWGVITGGGTESINLWISGQGTD